MLMNAGADSRDFGEAQRASTALFDRVRGELTNDNRDDVKLALQDVLRARDQVTAGVASTDEALPDLLHQLERALRQALVYPVSPSPA